MRAVNTPYFPMGGGLDLATPALAVPAGHLLECVNFAPDLNGGYRLTSQHEAFDGRPAPSDAVYYLLEVASTASFTVNDTLTGGTSGATAVVVDIEATTNSLVITKLSATGFTVSETVGASTVTAAEVENNASTAALEAQYLLAAADEYRDDIGPVSGPGVIRGIWRHKAKTYAFRDNAGGTAVDMYKASASGWTLVTLATHYVLFENGTIDFAVGETVTGATSGASGVIHRAVGHVLASPYTDGYLVLTGVTGGPFTAGENLQVSAVTNATANGGSVAVSFPAGGRYDFKSHNFLGSSSTYYVYGCNGVGPAFEIDNNDVVSPILMPQIIGAPSSDSPHLIEVHKGQLFLAFDDGIMNSSTVTDAMSFNGYLGAGQFGLSEEITGMKSVAGGVLMLWTRRQTWILSGTNSTDWVLDLISDSTGSLLWGAVPIERVYAWDDRGLVRMDRVQSFGDFQGATVSKRIQSRLSANSSNLIGSVAFKDRNQFWYMLSTGDFLICHVAENGVVEFGWGLLPFAPNVIYNAPDEDGNERIFVGGSDGFVYEMNKGTSHNGELFDFGFRTTYNHFGSPRHRKSFKHLSVELEASTEINFSIATEFNNSASHAQSNQGIAVSEVGGGEGFWDTALWNHFNWNGHGLPTSEIAISGTGVNLSLIIYGETNTMPPFTIQGFMVHYLKGRIDRG